MAARAKAEYRLMIGPLSRVPLSTVIGCSLRLRGQTGWAGTGLPMTMSAAVGKHSTHASLMR